MVDLHKKSKMVDILIIFLHLRPEAVALVDAFDVHDFTLGSALGSYDGQAYSRLYKSAMAAPINETRVSCHYHHIFIEF